MHFFLAGITLPLLVAALLTAPGEGVRLRHTNYIVWEATGGQPLSVTFSCLPRGQYADELEVRAFAPNGAELSSEVLAPTESRSLRITPKQSGMHLLQIRSGWNLATLSLGQTAHAFVATDRIPLQTVGVVERLYFFVPVAVSQVGLRLSASVTGEGLRVRIFNPQGDVVLEREGDFDRPENLLLAVPPDQAGHVWSLAILKPQGARLSLDDVMLSLLDPLPPYLALRPEWAEHFGRRSPERNRR